MNIGKIINTVLGWLGFGKTTRERTAEENITAALPLIKSTVAIGIQGGIRYGVAAVDRAAIAAQVPPSLTVPSKARRNLSNDLAGANRGGSGGVLRVENEGRPDPATVANPNCKGRIP